MKKLFLAASIAAVIAVAAFGVKANEPDPTDDGNIIVECVGANGPTFLGVPAFRTVAPYGASVPKDPLGPQSCWPHEHGRL
jgi:membrane-bound lytic murein transglycosylase B